ncbi:hypothetical protein HDU85_004931 [Gaertneriomyces sp. JEL0708]|nr:hypothetical protein HDU85_004931 [Gaertneriomyces sp. JEL0708]
MSDFIESCQAGYLLDFYPPDPATSSLWLANVFIAFAATVTAFIYLGNFVMSRYIVNNGTKKPLLFVNIVRLIYAGVALGMTLPVCLYPFILNAGLPCELRGGLVTFLKIVEMFSSAIYVGVLAILPVLTALTLVAGDRLRLSSKTGTRLRNASLFGVMLVQLVLMAAELATCEVVEVQGGLYPFIYGTSPANMYLWGVVLYDGFVVIIPCLLIMFRYLHNLGDLHARGHPLRGLSEFSLINGVIYVIFNVLFFATGFMSTDAENFAIVSTVATMLSTTGMLLHMWYLIYDSATTLKELMASMSDKGGETSHLTKTGLGVQNQGTRPVSAAVMTTRLASGSGADADPA